MQQKSEQYQYMETIAAQIDQLSTREQIDPVLDELEFIFELLSPDAQPQCEQLIAILMEKYQLARMTEK